MKYFLGSLFAFGFTLVVNAASTSQTFSAKPPGITQNTAPPVVMLTMPKDHQLFFKAYSDYEDLDPDKNDGPEITYKPTFSYTGYFDNKLCYQYSDGDNWFEPKEKAAAVEGMGSALYCNSGTNTSLWSGNFLNWASMTRIDILRLAFYGGKRVNPQPTGIDGILLERSHIPGDAHSFAKYYGGDDIRRLTPFPLEDSARSDCSGKDAQATAACNLVKKGITLCNTTSNRATSAVGLEDGQLSQNTTNPPLIRVALGNFSLWSANERAQCKYWDGPDFKDMFWTFGFNEYKVNPGNSALLDREPFKQSLNALMNSVFGSTATPTGFYFFHDSPTLNVNTEYVASYEPNYKANASQQIADYQARVVACNSKFLDGATDCAKYGTSYKPVGILQTKEYADRKIHWGLMSGSFSKNITGGALRKNVAEISDEIDTNGDFKAPVNGGIIAFLDNLRIVNWGYMQSGIDNDQRSSYVGWANNNCGAPGASGNYGKKATFNNGECVSWGNPLSETLLEAYRYLAGKTAPANTNTDETFFSTAARKSSMTSQTWSSNPLATAPTTTSTLKACSKLDVIAINASAVSYDGDDLGADLFTSIAADTKTIGQEESKRKNIPGLKYFVGDELGTALPTSPTPICSPKTVTDLSQVRGTCPDAPALNGSYLMAGMAYRANITPNINPYYGKGIQTTGVTLDMGRPLIEIPFSNDDKVTLLPTCRNLTKQGTLYLGSCALVDFKILKVASDLKSGRVLVIWEDSQQGSDFDQDVTQLIEYSLSGSQISVSTKMLSKSTNDILELGYIITGVEGAKEGPKNPLKINTGTAATDITSHSETFNVAKSANVMLEPPLYYAAKWGGFEANGSVNMPTQQPPTNYTAVRNPDDLRKSIDERLKVPQPAAFSYASISALSTLDDGTGLSVTTQFRPNAELKAKADGKIVDSFSWAGSLKAYFRSDNGYLREDSNQSGKLDDGDLIIAFRTSENGGLPDTRAELYSGKEPDLTGGSNLIGTPKSITEFNFSQPVFSAEANLAMVENYSTQGAYPIGTSEAKYDRTKFRYIFTAIDSNNDQLISGTEAGGVAFDTATGFPSSGTDANRSIWFDLSSVNSADLVNYIRGKQINTFRDRRIDFISGKSNDADDDSSTNASDSAEPWLLGDIVNSSPLIVGAPTAGYDTDYGDLTYTELRKKYKLRRNVLYVGANDGMLHAFNLGQYNPSTKKYDGLGALLGAELWGYVPFNLLPHLKWLTETNYSHNFYMDGRVKLYDVNIFPEDTDHPKGWGSILVATMRTGGAPYDIIQTDTSGNKTTSTLRSSVVVMDITNPEVAPKLIAEIPMPDNTYTTVNPDVVKFREFNADGTIATNKWYLALGSGVTDNTQFTSSKIPKIFMFDLINKSWVNNGAGVTIGTNNGWVGGINARDWDRDNFDDYLYFGTVEGTPSAPRGRLYRAKVTSSGTVGTPEPILEDTQQAFAATPFTLVDTKNKYWVFAGTGRYFSDSDNLFPNNQNSYYAIKEEVTTTPSGFELKATVNRSSLANLTGIKVRGNDDLSTDVSIGASTAGNRKALVKVVENNNGWYFNFDSVNSRNYTSTILSDNSLVFNTYEPGDECSPYGRSSQYRRDALSGLPRTFVRNSTDTNFLPVFRDLGIGAASDPSPGKNPATGSSLGAVDVEPPSVTAPRAERQSWRELPYSQ